MLRKVGVELLCLTVNFGKYNGNARHNYYEICFKFISEHCEKTFQNTNLLNKLCLNPNTNVFDVFGFRF